MNALLEYISIPTPLPCQSEMAALPTEQWDTLRLSSGFKVPQEIGGFKLESLLGKGGMGTVFKAHQTGLERKVAIKILEPRIAKEINYINRFRREAHASARLNHRNIVQGIAAGQDEASGLWYFAMEFVDGPDVRSMLKQHSRLSETRSLEIALDVARGLNYAHQNQMMHRDIKPDNILIDPYDQAKLADLGLARNYNTLNSVTAENIAMGTPLYMSPEQIQADAESPDGRTDIYSLGATLFHMIAGHPPFRGENSRVIMYKHMTAKPPMAHRLYPGISESTSRLICKMMQKDPDDRVQTAREMMDQIDVILQRLRKSESTKLRPTRSGSLRDSGSKAKVGSGAHRRRRRRAVQAKAGKSPVARKSPNRTLGKRRKK